MLSLLPTASVLVDHSVLKMSLTARMSLKTTIHRKFHSNKINIAKKIQNQEENTTTSGSGKFVHLEEATHVINVENNVIPKCSFITAYNCTLNVQSLAKIK
jgi:spore coat protein U-like protein